jgi:NifB/MoaA-like Fe-S oxidoreductase
MNFEIWQRQFIDGEMLFEKERTEAIKKNSVAV